MRLVYALHYKVIRSQILVSVLRTQEGTKSFYAEAETRIRDVSDSTQRMKRLWLVTYSGFIKAYLWGG